LTDIEPLTKKADEARDTHYKTVVGAFLGIDIIAALQFLTINSLDKRLTVALYCFMILIPLLALRLRAILLHAGLENYVLTWYLPVTTTLGILLSVAAMAAMFFHFSIRAGYVFCGLVVFGFLASHHYGSKLLKANGL